MYTDESGHESSCWGRSKISHGETWTIDAFTTVQSDESVTLRTLSHVTPLREGRMTTEYSAESSDLGVLRGRFTFIGGTILATGRSQEGDLLVVEALRRVDEERYEVCGELLGEGRLLSAWALTLTRER